MDARPMLRTLHLALVLSACALVVPACGRAPDRPPIDAGNVPADQDRDGDGLPDDWEINGVEYTDPANGTRQRLDLKAMGASPAHKDILLWLEWMESSGHTHKPDADTLSIVQRAFRTAPVTNIDGFPGINLHIVQGRTPVAEDEVLGSGTARNYDWSEFDAVKKNRLPAELHGTAFFTIFAHDITAARNSGIAKSIPGRDFIVSLAGFTMGVGTRQEKAGTLMHELGHALGLRHGGSDDIHYKPNYLSVMNYSFQLNGLAISGAQGNFDYSRFRLDATEPSLDEKIGLTTNATLAKYGTLYYCCNKCAPTPLQSVRAESIASSAVDWNCDTAVGSKTATDINRDNQVSTLAGLTDWENIILKPSGSAGVSAVNVVGTEPRDELTPDEADRVPLFPVADVQARRIGNGVLVEWEPVPLDRVVAYRIYRAVGAAPPELIATVENTDHPSYGDVTVQGGARSYSVTAVFVPHALAPPSPPPPPPPSPAPPLSKPQAIAGLTERWITSAAAIAAIRAAAPAASAELETLGGVTPQTRSGSRFVDMLRETDQSRAVRVVVP